MPSTNNSSVKATRTKPRILVVDPSNIMRRALVKILEDDYEVAEAVSAEQAWDCLQSTSVQALITGLNLPDMSGYGLLEQVRDARSFKLRHLPVLVVSEENEDERLRAEEAGANDFITKPFDSKQLLRQVRLLSYAVNKPKNGVADDQERDAAMVDPLTGLPNRSYFFFRGPKDLSFAQRHNKDLAIILTQMDNVEELIEEHGRPVVKQLLKKLANYIQAAVRTEDTVARVGARRFAVIAPNTNEFGAKEVADRVLKKVQQTFFNYASKQVSFKVSIGLIAPRVHSVEGFDEIIDLAAQRLDMAVWAGGNTVVYGNKKPEPVENAEAETDADIGVGVDFAHDTGVHTAVGRAVDIVPEWEQDQQEEKPTKAAPEPQNPELPDDETAPALEVAMWLLENGQIDKLKPHFSKLLSEILPLLEHADSAMDLDLRDALNQLKGKIKSDPRKSDQIKSD